MTCTHCGFENASDAVFCASCGGKVMTPDAGATTVLEPEAAPAYATAPSAPYPSQPVPAASVTPAIPPEYKPLSPWAFFAYQVLFMIPIVGFVLLIVMSFAPRNKCLKNLARSYFCGLLIIAIAFLVGLLVTLAFSLIAAGSIGSMY